MCTMILNQIYLDSKRKMSVWQIKASQSAIYISVFEWHPQYQCFKIYSFTCMLNLTISTRYKNASSRIWFVLYRKAVGQTDEGVSRGHPEPTYISVFKRHLWYQWCHIVFTLYLAFSKNISIKMVKIFF